MQITRSATSVSWIPSDSIPGLLKIPMEKGLMHYDPPPPLTVTDLDGMRRRGEFRFANILRAWIHVEDGKIRDYGYAGGVLMGLTPVTAGPLHLMLPTKPNRVIQHPPQVTGNAVTFVQTAGGRPGFSFLRPSARWPFLLTRPFTVWTTIELTINADGTYRQHLAGSSPFPRHWLYDDGGRLAEKTALTRAKVWLRTVSGTHTPWGGKGAELHQMQHSAGRVNRHCLQRSVWPLSALSVPGYRLSRGDLGRHQPPEPGATMLHLIRLHDMHSRCT